MNLSENLSILVSVSCKHRKNAFLGCAEIMDLLKAKVPIWKKEIYDDDSSKWIHNCTGCKIET